MIGAFIYEISPSLQSQFNNDIELYYNDSIWGEFWFKSATMLGISAILLFPLNIQRNISKLRYSSIFGMFCLLLITIVIVYQTPRYYEYNQTLPGSEINWYDVSKAFTSEMLFFKGTATLFYAYSCHYGAFPIYEKLYNNNERRTNKVLISSIIIDAIFYLTVGICGYITQPMNTPDIIIKRNKIPNESDILMTSCRILMCFTLIAKIPANYNSLRLSLFNLFFKNSEITFKK